MKDNKTRKILLWLVQLAVIFASFSYLLIKSRSVSAQISLHFGHNAWLLTIAFCMLPLNIFLEAIKWKMLISRQQQISTLEALVIVIKSIPYGIITPSRIGEWFKRGAELKKTAAGTINSAIGGFLQQYVTLSVGLLAVLTFTHKKLYTNLVIILLLTLLSSFALIVALKTKFSFLPPLKNLFLAQILAFVRYFTFSTQYVLILFAYGLKMSIIKTYLLVFSTFFATNILPLIPVADLGLRTATMAFLTKQPGNTALYGIAGFTLWFINVGLMIIVGNLLTAKNLTQKFFSTKS